MLLKHEPITQRSMVLNNNNNNINNITIGILILYEIV